MHCVVLHLSKSTGIFKSIKKGSDHDKMICTMIKIFVGQKCHKWGNIVTYLPNFIKFGSKNNKIIFYTAKIMKEN